MKKLILVLLLTFPVLAMAQNDKVLDIKDLDKRDGMYYDYDNRPYTGKAVQMFGELKKAECEFKNGQIHGMFYRYDKAGTKLAEAEYKFGKMDGPQTHWHPNGNLKMQGAFKAGQLHGVVKKYNEAGELQEEITWKEGKQIAVRRLKDGEWEEKSREASEAKSKANAKSGEKR